MGMFANQDRKKSAFEEYLDNLPMPGVGDGPVGMTAPAPDVLNVSRLTMSPDYLQLLAGGTAPLPTTSGPELGYTSAPSFASVSPFLGLPQSGPSFGDITPADLAARDFSDLNYNVDPNSRPLGANGFAPKPAVLNLPRWSDGGESFGQDGSGWSFDRDGRPNLTSNFAGKGDTISSSPSGGLSHSVAEVANGASGAIGDALIGRANAALMKKSEPPEGISHGINHAGRQLGIDPDFLFRAAWRESTYNPKNGNPDGVYGLYQYKPQDWLETIHRYGSQIGLGKIAGNIKRLKDGTYTTGDKGVDDKIASYRDHPYISALVAGARMRNQAPDVARISGRDRPTWGEMYATHFLGKGGAMIMARAAQTDPDAPAYISRPDAAKHNHNMFFASKGNDKPFSVRQFWQNLEAEMAPSRK